jgi:hypothetical protein
MSSNIELSSNLAAAFAVFTPSAVAGFDGLTAIREFQTTSGAD